MNEIEGDGFAYKVTDKDELDRLDKEKTFRMYSGMQEVDGKLYSPYAIIDGKRTDATEIGVWMGADERPDLVKNGKFTLVKTDKNKGVGEGDVPAAYNPYIHTSTSMMNDQFTGEIQYSFSIKMLLINAESSIFYRLRCCLQCIREQIPVFM